MRKNKGSAALALADRCFIGESACASQQQGSHAMNSVPRSSFHASTIDTILCFCCTIVYSSGVGVMLQYSVYSYL